MFKIRFTGEAENQFLNLQQSKDKSTVKAVGKAIAYMNANLRHPSLKTHKFDDLQSPFGGDVFESYAKIKRLEPIEYFGLTVQGKRKDLRSMHAAKNRPKIPRLNL